MNMPSALAISYFGFLIISVLFAVGSISIGIGTVHEPGPGFVPCIASVILCICSVFALFKNFRTIRSTAATIFKLRYLKKAILLYAAIVFYMIAIKYLGYPLTTFLFMVFLFKGIEPQKWINAIFYAAFASGFSYLIFVLFLKVQFI